MVTGDGNNDTGFSNPEYDRLIALSRQTADPAGRRALLQQAETLLLDEAPVRPLLDARLPQAAERQGVVLSGPPHAAVYLS